MDRLFQDVRFGLRLLLKARAFTVTVLLTLALCIGATAAIFAVVNVAGAVAVVLALVALAAWTIPARRAARIDPLVALAD